MAVELASLLGAALAGAGSVWGTFKIRDRKNGHGNGTNLLEYRLKQVESQVIPLAGLPGEIRHLTKSVDSLSEKVDDLMRRY